MNANPLRMRDTALPPQALLAAKLLFLSLLLNGDIAALPAPYLPLWLAIDAIPVAPDLIARVLQGLMLGAGILLCANRWPRTCALVIGSCLMFVLLANRPAYRNARFFVAAMFILIGLYQSGSGLRFVRWQFSMMYFGSALNKLLEADWRSGQYFEHWMRQIVESPVYGAAADVLPPLGLGQMLGWGTIAFEFTLSVALLVRAARPVAIAAALAFHSASVLMAGTTFGVFFAALLSAYPVFANWPPRGGVACTLPESWRQPRRLLTAIDFDSTFALREGPLRVRLGEREFHGLAALVAGAGLLPPVYAVAIAIVCAT
jgi:hypothetical protein